MTTESRRIAKPASSIRSRFACWRASAATSIWYGGEAHGHLDVGPASPDRQHRAARARIRPHSRRRWNRQYSINLNADTAPGHALDESSNNLRRIINEVKLPPGYSYQMRGQTQNLDETTDNLILAMALASIFVYMVLAAQFESFIDPIIILTLLPLSIPFALISIWATGRTRTCGFRSGFSSCSGS